VCGCTERSIPDEKMSSAVADSDTDTAVVAAELAVKCDDEDKDTATSNGADCVPATVTPPVDNARPCHPTFDTDAEPASPDNVPVTSESASTDASPVHSNDVDTSSNSVTSLLTDADTCVSSDPVAAGD